MAAALHFDFGQFNIFGNIDFRRANIRAGSAANTAVNIVKGQCLILTKFNISVDIKWGEIFRADLSASSTSNALVPTFLFFISQSQNRPGHRPYQIAVLDPHQIAPVMLPPITTYPGSSASPQRSNSCVGVIPMDTSKLVGFATRYLLPLQSRWTEYDVRIPHDTDESNCKRQLTQQGHGCQNRPWSEILLGIDRESGEFRLHQYPWEVLS